LRVSTFNTGKMTIDLQAFLKELISLPGLSGYEEPVSKVIQKNWQPMVDEINSGRLGSLHGLRRGTAPEPRPAILLSAHMDAIGMMVTGIVDGFLRFTEIGGLDARVLPGQVVTVHGREELTGVIVQPPAHLLPPSVGENAVPLQYLLVDTGLLPSEVVRRVRVGDLISFAQAPLDTASETLVGHSLDNRASVAALTYCLELLQGRQHAWDVWAIASTQEEVTLGGAKTSAFRLDPSLAIVIDVTFASSPGSPAHRTLPLAKGPALGWGPNVHPALFKSFKELADRLEIPYGIEVMPRNSGTDAFAIQVVGAGIPCMVLGIPLRYMHTPVEMIAIKDIQRAGRLMAEFIANLPVDYLDRLTWED
jgi:putative aminopeptidase FrvX